MVKYLRVWFIKNVLKQTPLGGFLECKSISEKSFEILNTLFYMY